jgi:AcrR family transcriptional regulator
MEKSSNAALRGRGRPATELHSRVVEDLIAATESALIRKTAKEITVREISTAAGTSEAMIRYYFGSKEGLLLTVLKDFMDESPHKNSEKIIGLCLGARSIKPLVDELCKFHYSKPNLIKMIVVELLGSSGEFKKVYLNKYGNSIVLFTEALVTAMRDQGIYRDNINVSFIAMSLIRLIVAPIMEAAVTGAPPIPPEVKSGEWAAFITHTIDSISM